MQNLSIVIGNILRRSTRQPIADGVIDSGAQLRDELGVDSLGMLILFEMIGEDLQIDPVKLSERASELVTFGDLIVEVMSLSEQKTRSGETKIE